MFRLNSAAKRFRESLCPLIPAFMPISGGRSWLIANYGSLLPGNALFSCFASVIASVIT